MAFTTTNMTNITDSIAQSISDLNTAFITQTGSNSPTAATILSSTTGTGASNTQGRVLALADLASELLLLSPTNRTMTALTTFITSVRTLSTYYPSYYYMFDALDLVANSLTAGGLNAYLTANSLQVNAFFANAFNAYQAVAVSLGLRSSAPTAIATANYFPYAAVDSMWSFTASGATTFSTNAVGTNATTSVSGGGVGQFYIYKTNATNAVGGATFTVTYTTAAGSSTTATYSSTSGVPLASGSLSAGYAISGAIGSAITGVTGTGMTSGEAYTIGMKLVRSAAY